MSEPTEPLTPKLARVVEAERTRPAVSEALASRLLGRLDATIAAGGGGSPEGGSSAPPGSARAGRPLLGRVPFGVSLFVLGGLAGAALHAAFTRRAPVAPRVVVSASPVPTPAPPAPSLPVAPPPHVDETPRAKPRAHASESQAHPSGHDDELNAERALLEVARTALARGQPEATVDVLRRHAKKYPHGRLAEERDSLWIVAYVQAELYPEARRRAERFRREYPESMLLPAVEHALKGIP